MDPLAAHSELKALSLPSITFAEQWGSAQRCIRGCSEIRQTREHCFNLLLVLGGSWRVAHGARARFEPGDLIFHDSRYALDVDLPDRHSDFNLQLSEQFVCRWIPDPGVLIGKRLSKDCQWGRVLSSYVAQLSPEFVLRSPLPQSILIDQIGALLALTASELGGGSSSPSVVERSLREQVCDQILQRCTETKLQAADVASALNISSRTLHRILAACGETFGGLLIRARVENAVRMLRSPLFDRVTAAEIRRRAGFSDASHFTKVLRRQTGQTPAQIRRRSVLG